MGVSSAAGRARGSWASALYVSAAMASLEGGTRPGRGQGTVGGDETSRGRR
jgi:hypothetical protein